MINVTTTSAKGNRYFQPRKNWEQVKFRERPDALKQYLRRKLSDFEKKETKGE